MKNTQTLTKHDKSRQSPSIGSPIQHKNVTRTFCQTPNMQRSTQMIKKCMNIMKFASIHAQTATRGPSRYTNDKWDLAQSKILKNFHKN